MARWLIDTNILSYLIDTASPFHKAARVLAEETLL